MDEVPIILTPMTLGMMSTKVVCANRDAQSRSEGATTISQGFLGIWFVLLAADYFVWVPDLVYFVVCSVHAITVAECKRQQGHADWERKNIQWWARMLRAGHPGDRLLDNCLAAVEAGKFKACLPAELDCKVLDTLRDRGFSVGADEISWN